MKHDKVNLGQYKKIKFKTKLCDAMCICVIVYIYESDHAIDHAIVNKAIISHSIIYSNKPQGLSNISNVVQDRPSQSMKS